MGKPLFSISEIRMLEEQATASQQISESTLMERAGQSAFRFLQAKWPQAKKILVVCGPGNNGGDGYVLAKEASNKGIAVDICTLGSIEKCSQSTKSAYFACESLAIRMQPLCEGQNISTLANEWLREAYDVIVDAIFGIGLQREITGVYRLAIEAINASLLPVLAIDVPSGVNADTGSFFGSAVNAQMTVTFIGFKRGMFTGDAPDYCGEVVLADLGVFIDENLISAHDHLLCPGLIRDHLLRRKKNSQKGNFGHVLVIGGNRGTSGAARLAAEAALRTGAGLVSVATLPEHPAIINAHYPEIMCHSVLEPEQLTPLIRKATVIVLGPGLGQDEWAKKLLSSVIACPLPKVIDADGLNLLGSYPVCQDNWILTPHPGEAARLLGFKSAAEVEANRFAAIEKLAALGGHWVLKGCGSLIKNRHGPVGLCQFGNPGMASGGMGDALSGILGALVAQKIEISLATKLGVLIHALAGDLSAKRGERGLLASDLIQALGSIVNPG